MRTTPMPRRLLAPVLLLALGLGAATRAPAAEPAPTPRLSEQIADKPLPRFQADLLDLAFEAATALPVNPHIKSRSREQEEVVAAALALHQPRKALGYAMRIDNWRRGSALADVALYAARHGQSDVEAFVALARDIASLADQDWRRDQVRVKLAQAEAWLGHADAAARLESGVDESQRGKVARVHAMQADAASFDRQVEALASLAATGNFDLIRNVLAAYAELFNRFYNDGDRRARVEAAMRAASEKLPLFLRVELLLQLAGFAADHADRSRSLALVDEAQGLIDSAAWPVEFFVPMMGRVSAARFRAGDAARARADADAALALFDAQRQNIQSFEQAGALRPLAESYQAMGDSVAALRVYRKAVEAGAVNPNARPRAEDLSATCRSMAGAAVEPDTALWARMVEIKAGLDHPW